jgi:ABC-type sugar transport system permease subunit
MTTTASVNTGSGSSNNINWLNVILGFALLLPTGAFLLLNLFQPTLNTIQTSFQNYSGVNPNPQYIGLDNYSRIFQDQAFGNALGFTLLIMLVRLLVVAFVPILLAVAINELGQAARWIFRSLFTIPIAAFMPVFVALVWSIALNPVYGLFQGQPWLSDRNLARSSVLLIDGLYTFGLACGVGLIFYLAALRSAADETSSRRRVIAPLIVSWIVGILATIALALQSFDLSYILTQGGPGQSTMTLALYQFRSSFQTFRLGYGTAIATLTLAVLGLLGLIAGVIVVFSRLRLSIVAPTKPSALFGSSGKTAAIILLCVVLIGCAAAVALSLLPPGWVAANAASGSSYVSPERTVDGYGQFFEKVSVPQVTVNTLIPAIAAIFLVQIPLAYLGALGIGALRPLGKWSEILLLPFSPWLFVTVGPLSVAAWMNLRSVKLLNTVAALTPPILISIPILFILTLFFKGQELRWRAARAAGQSEVSAFFRLLILPSLPLAILLALVALFFSLQDLLWPLLAVNGPQLWTATLSLFQLRAQFATSPAILGAGVTYFGLPMFVFFLLVFGVFQVLYLDRLALMAGGEGTETPEPERVSAQAPLDNPASGDAQASAQSSGEQAAR